MRAIKSQYPAVTTDLDRRDVKPFGPCSALMRNGPPVAPSLTDAQDFQILSPRRARTHCCGFGICAVMVVLFVLRMAHQEWIGSIFGLSTVLNSTSMTASVFADILLSAALAPCDFPPSPKISLARKITATRAIQLPKTNKIKKLIEVVITPFTTLFSVFRLL